MNDLTRIEAGVRLSEAVIYGGKLYSCGVVPDSAVCMPAYEQTCDVLAQIDALLAAAGSDKTRIIKAIIWLADMADYDAMNRAWDAWVVPGKTPARATVEARLANPGWRVEIMVEAACGA